MLADLSEYMLNGNSKLSLPITNEAGEMIGFVIDNPRGPDLKVSLQHLSLKGATTEENNHLRQVVYDAYALGATTVPAFTPLAECVAESATVIVHSDALREGMYFVHVQDPTTKNYYANIQGNPLLPDNSYTFQFGGMKETFVVEQQNKYYQGQDGLWYTTNPLELIAHELVHGCNKLQGWSHEGEQAYISDKKAGRVPDDEIKAINFVNHTILEPREMPGRNPEGYYSAKPQGATLGNYVPLDAEALEKLRHGPIPIELKDYDHPSLMSSNVDLQVKSNHSDELARMRRMLAQAGLCTESQSTVIAQRIAENASYPVGHPCKREDEAVVP